MVEVCAIFWYCLLWLDAYIYNTCMYMAHVCYYVCCCDSVGYVGMFVVLRPLLKIVFF